MTHSWQAYTFVNRTGTHLSEVNFNQDCVKELCRVTPSYTWGKCYSSCGFRAKFFCGLVANDSGPWDVYRVLLVLIFLLSFFCLKDKKKKKKSFIGIRKERPREFLTYFWHCWATELRQVTSYFHIVYNVVEIPFIV